MNERPSEPTSECARDFSSATGSVFVNCKVSVCELFQTQAQRGSTSDARAARWEARGRSDWRWRDYYQGGQDQASVGVKQCRMPSESG